LNKIKLPYILNILTMKSEPNMQNTISSNYNIGELCKYLNTNDKIKNIAMQFDESLLGKFNTCY
jgi:hypothetical protein